MRVRIADPVEKKIKGHAMKKKAKLNPVAWLSNVIFLLQKGDLKIEDVFEMTNIPRNDMCESLLYEHPSIVVVAGQVSFQPFASISNQEELVDFIRRQSPAGVRRIDLRGIYAFVDADLDELLFHGTIVHLDNRQDSLTVPFDAPTLPDSVKAMFLDAVSHQS